MRFAPLFTADPDPYDPRAEMPDDPSLPSTPDELRREHQKTRLLALSLDGAASPSITLRELAENDERDSPYGWGFAWYPEDSRAAQVVKDPSSIGDNAMSKVLREWEHFESTMFVCHLRGAARALKEHDTHPFARSYGGRDFVFAHNGDLEGDLKSLLPVNDPALEPIGRTDSERAFAWLLERLSENGARSLAELGWEKLYGYLQHLDSLGTANFLLTDGVDLVAYHDAELYNGLCLTRIVPPHEVKLRGEDIVVDFEDAGDRGRTIVAFATVPLEGSSWTCMQGGQMIVARRGLIVFDTAQASGDLSRAATAVQSVPQPVPLPGANAGPTENPPSVVTAGAPRREAAAQQAARGGEPKPLEAPSRPWTRGLAMPAEPETVPESRVLSVVHETVYRYDHPVERSTHLYRLRPVHDRMQTLVAFDLDLGVGGLRHDYEDVFGNGTTRVEIETDYTELRICARSLVRVHPPNVRDLLSLERRHTIPLVWMPWQRQMMLPYLLPPELPETQLHELYEYAMSFVDRQDHDLLRTLLDINQTIYRDYSYVSGSTTLATTPFDVYVARKGVCQDFANLFICLARLLSIPARYRVGYIHTGADYENKIQSEASHAWVELYLPWRGWIGFDPTNGVLAGLDHVRVASGRNYRDATPTSGTIYKGGGSESLVVDVRVELPSE
jgi:transglutaminase-like putative cysteine protease/predicted glutamine amidotransferase